MAIVFDMQPTEGGFHGEVFGVDFIGGHALADEVRAVKDEDHSWVFDGFFDSGQKGTGMADEVGFNFESEGEAFGLAEIGDLAELIDGLGEVGIDGGAFGVVEGEATNEFAIEGVGELAGLFDVFLQVLFEGDKAIVGSVVDIEEFDFADGRTDGGDVESVFSAERIDGLDFWLGQEHDILDSFAGIDEAEGEIAESQGSEAAELLQGEFLVSGFVREAAQQNLRWR